MNASYDRSKDIAHGHSISAKLLAWYALEKRDLPWRKTGDPYAIWVSEVMLQQTQVKTVIPYYERFLERFPRVEQLSMASLEDVLTIWSGLGYYSRARRMWEGSRYICDAWGGKMPEDYKSLLRVPGIGKYTAGAIASIAFGQRVSAIDGNVSRVVSRLLAWPEPVETVSSYRHFSDHLAVWQSVDQPGEFNQALMELGATVCLPTKSNCASCPLAQFCDGYFEGKVLRYPVKKPKAQRQVVTRLTFVLRRGDQVFLQKRPSAGLLADLWEFPGVELSNGDIHSLKDTIPDLAMDECFDLLQQAVPERVFNARMRDQFEQGITWHGPIWYTFSHRRWKIIWAIIDFPDRPDSSNLLNLLKTREAKPTGVLSLRELDGEYESNSSQVTRINESLRWVSIDDLVGIALPVAFTAIVKKLTQRNLFSKNDH